MWPMEQGMDSAARAEQGKLFHRLVELYSRGQDVQPLLPTVDPQLRQWWQVFTASPHFQPQGEVLAEVPLWIQQRGVPVIALLDRVVRQSGRFHIVDWKTEEKRTPNTTLQQSWQVRLYPLMLCIAGKHLNQGNPVSPESVKMTIWYANHPQNPYELQYSTYQFEQDLHYLDQKIQSLETLAAQSYPMTSQIETCSTCLFRSRCYGLIPDSLDPELFASLDTDPSETLEDLL